MIKRICCRLGFQLLVVLITCSAGINSLEAQDRLWGMTSGGGTRNQGAIFSMNPDGTGLTVNYSFIYGVTGRQPNGTLVLANNLLYGVTKYGGANNNGVIFSFDTTTGVYTKLFDFDGANSGANPYEGMTLGSDGKLYGITSAGGANGGGVIFSFDPVAATFQKLYDMAFSTGSYSFGPLSLYHDKFYGVTLNGGANGYGVFFSFDPSSNTYTDIYDYSNSSWDYYQSPGQMVVYNDVLYGTSAGGDSGYGQLFSYDDGGGGYKDLNDFTGGTLFEPSGIVLYNGKLYGVAWEGGVNYYGGIFSYDPGSGKYNDLMGFDASVGYGTYGNIMVYNGNFLAIGSSNILQVAPDGTYTDLQDFYSAQPNLGISQSFYGTLLLPVNAAVGTTPQTISFSNVTIAKTYGDANFDPGATASSGLKITYTSSDKTVAKGVGSKIQIVGAGTCVITATQRGNAVYAAAAPVSDTLVVNQAPLVITADDKTVNQLQPLPVLTARYTGFAYNDTVSSLTTAPVISTVATSSSPQGTYPITVSGAASPNYNISYVPGTLTVVGQLQTFQLVDSAVRNYGDADFALVKTTNSGLPVTYSIDSADIAAVSASDSTKIHITGAGLTRVIARQSGNATWAAGYDTVTLQVNKAPLTITANDTSIVYGQPVPAFTANYQGFVYGEGVSSFTVPPQLSSTATETPVYPGIYQIQISNAVARNYVLTYINGIFTVNPSGDSLNAWCSAPKVLSVNVMSGKARKATVLLHSLDGRQVFISTVTLAKGLNYFSFPVNVAAGIYIARLNGEDIKLAQKVIF